MQQLYNLATANVQGFIKAKVQRRHNSDWSGKICMLIDSMYMPLGLWKSIYDLKHAKIPYEVTINGLFETFDSAIQIQEVQGYFEALDIPFMPYDKQFDFITKMLKARKCTLTGATSMGKTFLTYLTLRY